MTFLVCAGNRQQQTRSENTLRRMEHSSGWNYSSIVVKLERLDSGLGDRQECGFFFLSAADKAEAVFIQVAAKEKMQSIHHVVMTTLKRSINPGRLQYR